MPPGIAKAIGYLLGAGAIYFFYKQSHEAGKNSRNLKVTMIKGLAIVLVIAYFANATLGTHSENCDNDPIYGQCDTIQDFVPSPNQYRDNFLFWLLLSGVPIAFGIYKGNNDKKLTKTASDSDDDSVIRAYGKVVEEVSKETLTKYPALTYPESLLPFNKSRIRLALENSIKLVEDFIKISEKLESNEQEKQNIEKNKQDLTALKTTLFMLDRFTHDKEANEANKKILANKKYYKELEKRKGK